MDEAFKGTDREAVEMAAYLLRNDGLFVGSSAAMNCVGAVKAARALGPGHTVVTVSVYHRALLADLSRCWLGRALAAALQATGKLQQSMHSRSRSGVESCSAHLLFEGCSAITMCQYLD